MHGAILLSLGFDAYTIKNAQEIKSNEAKQQFKLLDQRGASTSFISKWNVRFKRRKQQSHRLLTIEANWTKSQGEKPSRFRKEETISSRTHVISLIYYKAGLNDTT